MKIIGRTAVVAAATLAGIASTAVVPTGIAAGAVASPAAAGCTAAGWRNATTIPVGRSPYGVAVNTRTDMIYTANSGDTGGPGTVSVINGRTRTVVATIPGGPPPVLARPEPKHQHHVRHR